MLVQNCGTGAIVQNWVAFAVKTRSGSGPRNDADDLRVDLDVARRFASLGLFALALGVAVLLYRGPWRWLIRGHVGDIAATMLVYAVIGLARPSWSARARAIVTLAIASAIELVQIAWHATSFTGELLVGGTFDPVDFVAYVVGIAIAYVYERAGRADHAPSVPAMMG